MAQLPRVVGTALSCQSSGSAGPTLPEIWSDLWVMLCVEPGVGLYDPCGSISTWDIL